MCVMVLPGQGKSFEQFQTDDAVCRQWAREQTERPAQSSPEIFSFTNSES
jgi:hypothetical protein